MEEPRAWWRRINWQLLVEIAVFAVAVRVACIYSGQLDQMIKSNGLTEQTMRLDQRAWVAVTAVNSKQPPQIKQRFTYSVHFIDTGKRLISKESSSSGKEGCGTVYGALIACGCTLSEPNTSYRVRGSLSDTGG